jgi:hypothetical protein
LIRRDLLKLIDIGKWTDDMRATNDDLRTEVFILQVLYPHKLIVSDTSKDEDKDSRILESLFLILICPHSSLQLRDDFSSSSLVASSRLISIVRVMLLV